MIGFQMARLAIVALSLLGPACSRSQRAPQGPVRDAQIVTAENVAMAAFHNGNYSAAERLFQRALGRAQLIDDRGEVAKAAYFVCACRLRERDLTGALEAIDQARAEAAGHDPAMTDDLDLLAARCLVLEQRLPEAAALASHALAAGGSSPARRRSWLLVQAECACAAGDATEAKRLLAEAVRIDPNGADSERVAGVLALGDRHWKGAATRFDAEAQLHQASGDFPSMSEALVRSGGAHEAAGDANGACDRFLRAEQSLQRQARADEARAALDRAAIIAQRADDPALSERVDRVRTLSSETPKSARE